MPAVTQPAPTELDRLAAARPPILADSEPLVSRSAEDQILAAVLNSADGQTTPRRPATTRWPRPSRTGTVAAAAVLAAAVTAGTLTVAASHRAAAPALRARTVAYRTGSAMAAALAKDVIYTDASFAPGTAIGGFSAGVTVKMSPDGRMAVVPATAGTDIASIRAWTRGAEDREQQFDSAGALAYDESAVVSNGMVLRRFVSYPGKSCKTASTPLSQDRLRWNVALFAASLLTVPALSATSIAVSSSPSPSPTPAATRAPAVRPVVVRGEKMLRLTEVFPSSSPAVLVWLPFTSMPQTDFMAGPAFRPRVATIWVDAATYLPVRATLTGPGGQVLADETLTFLPPTKANLAELVPAPVPAGWPVSPEPWSVKQPASAATSPPASRVSPEP